MNKFNEAWLKSQAHAAYGENQDAADTFMEGWGAGVKSVQPVVVPPPGYAPCNAALLNSGVDCATAPRWSSPEYGYFSHWHPAPRVEEGGLQADKCKNCEKLTYSPPGDAKWCCFCGRELEGETAMLPSAARLVATPTDGEVEVVRLTFNGEYFAESKTGEWVAFADHRAHVTRLQAERDQQRKRLEATRARFTRRNGRLINSLGEAILERDAAQTEKARLQALSVTNIMLEVVPGDEGMGEEVYAKSAADVQAKFGQFEDLEAERDTLQSELTKARELLRHVDSNMPHSFREGWKTEVHEFLAHQSTPAAKGGSDV